MGVLSMCRDRVPSGLGLARTAPASAFTSTNTLADKGVGMGACCFVYFAFLLFSSSCLYVCMSVLCEGPTSALVAVGVNLGGLQTREGG